MVAPTPTITPPIDLWGSPIWNPLGVLIAFIELRINNGYIQESGLLWEYETKWNFPTIGKKKTPGDCDAGVRQKLSNRSQ